jgi:hypothetical protein
LAALQFRKKFPVESFGVGQQEYSQTLQVHAQLITEHIRGVGELRGYFR